VPVKRLLVILALAFAAEELPVTGGPLPAARQPATGNRQMPSQPIHKRALLIGINDYTASHLPRQSPAVPERDWRNLSGSVNDVESMREMLMLLHGFEAHDIVTLTDQAATRAAILHAIEAHLLAPAAKDDIVFFFYAGHGSRVLNTRSSEPDHYDESIVPADSRRGARDIRDKELRRLFNRILDRGARLTVMLDDCYSGSGARGLPTGAIVRGIKPDHRDVADGADAGPRPEDRGALVIAAAQDFERANETKDDDRQIRGAFTWAWIRAMRDASINEPALDTFLRAHGRLRAEWPSQQPVLAANASARRAPFLGARVDRRDERMTVAVVKLRNDGTAVLQGGWANGLSIGSNLRLPNDPHTRITVTKLLGLGQCEAHVEHGRIEPGMLLEQSGWVASPPRPLRVCISRIAKSHIPIEGLGHLLVIVAKRRQLRWIIDPTTTTPAHLIRHGDRGWQLLAAGAPIRQFSDDDAGAEAAINAIPRGSSVFVQFPAPASFALPESVETTTNPTNVDYILTGRYANGHLTYAWVRPGVTRVDRRSCGLPLRTAWVAHSSPVLRDAAFRLRKILAWQLLESPPIGRSPYHLALRRESTRALVSGAVTGHARYRAVLRGTNLPPRLEARYVYVFVIDSHGRSILLFPRNTSGSVENHFPVDDAIAPPPEIFVTTFEVAAPYGVDTYVLLTTDEPLPNPSILEWDGVRVNPTRPSTPLEQFLVEIGYGTRSIVTPTNWSIERFTWESLPQTSARRVSSLEHGRRSIRTVPPGTGSRSRELRAVRRGRGGRRPAGDARDAETRGPHPARRGVGVPEIGGTQTGDQSGPATQAVDPARLRARSE